MRIKCVVKNVIIFDLIFDTDQKKSKSNFSCSGGGGGGGVDFEKKFPVSSPEEKIACNTNVIEKISCTAVRKTKCCKAI